MTDPIDSNAADAKTIAGRDPQLSPSPTVLRPPASTPAPTDLGATPRIAIGPGPTPAVGRPFGHYQLESELGRGGMGVVYKAYHPGLKSHFAVKVLLAGDDASHEDVRRFYHEAQASARLKHPGIVAVHDVGEHEGKTYFAMEYVEGAGLDRVIADPVTFGIAPAAGAEAGQRPGLNTSAALRMAREIAEAVQAAHEAGVIHRDLKPQNVLRDRSGILKVTDFGLAKVVEPAGATATRTGTLLGTPAYMSPEQAAGRVSEVDARSDVYQVGAILYELLTGQPPYPGASAMQVVLAVMAEDPKPPRKLNPRIDRDAETICLKAMAREKAKRYATARELGEDCARALAGEAIRARPEAWWEKGARWTKRRKSAVGLGSALLLALVIAGAAKWETERSRQEQDRLQRDLLDKASQAVLDYENTVMSVKLDDAGRRALAKQPLATLEMLLERRRDFGPLYSWRGMTKDLIGGTAKELADAEADLDKGCALSPELAVVWFLRGMHHVEIYSRSRSLPNLTTGATDVVFTPPPSESAEEKRRRELGFADLTRMIGEAEHDSAFEDEGARMGQALAALYRGGDAECRRVLALIEGIERPKAWRLRGLALYYLMRFEESAAALGHALEAWPEDADGWNSLGLADSAVALRISARGADPRSTYAKAAADFDEAFQRNGEFVNALINRGIVFTHLGEAEAARGIDPQSTYGKAVGDFDEALRRHPESAPAYLSRGTVYHDLGKAEAVRGLDPRATYGKAMADFDEALRCNPEFAEVYNNRAGVLQGLAPAEAARGLDPRESFGKSVADLGEVLRRNPESAQIYNMRGVVSLQLGEAEALQGLDPRATYGHAVADFGEALGRIPEYAEAYHNRGIAHGKLGEAAAAQGLDPRAQYGRAMADLDETLRRKPEYVEAYANRGNVYRCLGAAEAAAGLDPLANYGKAVADLGEALRRNPEFAQAYNLRGRVFAGLGEAEAARGLDPQASLRKAEADYTAALERRYPQAQTNLGLLYRMQGRFDEAIAAFEASARLLPAQAAWAQARIEETRALQQMAQVEPLDRECSLAYQALQTADYPAARARYEKGLALLDEALLPLSDAERTVRLAAAPLRALLVNAHYNLACICALASDGRKGPRAASRPVPPEEAARLRDQAFHHLESAIEFGWSDLKHLEADTDLEPLHSDPRWGTLVEKLR